MVPGENTQIVAIQGMCATATAAADEPRALCIIRDLSSSQWDDGSKSAINLPASTTGSELLREVCKKFGYHPDTFELILQRKSDKATIHVHEHGDQTLEEMGFDCGEHERNNLIIADKNSMPPKRIEVSDSVSGVSPNIDMESIKGKLTLDRGDCPSTYVPPPAPPPYTSGNTEYSYSYSNVLTKQETGFVGLVNQAMTCYLNSLLQTLFMTPEFRNALYRWEFDGNEDEGSKSIPFQLQKLFLQLQTSKKPAVGTTELTTSFGWDSSEAWQQHDVQELCRVMFDALEQKFKNTEQSDLISTLYEGKLKDYVKCLECGYESAREDTFLDVPLVVRPFGSSQAYGSVGEALQAFVTPEILQGSNQYFCEQCNKKCDAHKGLKFMKFPYLLTLQLKRFDFDPNTMHRIKLNDRVSFPEALHLNEFIKTGANSELVDDGDTTDSGSALDDEGACFASGCKTGCSLSPEACSDNDLPDDDEGIDVSPHTSSIDNNQELCVNERNAKKPVEKGPYVYELFSIMVHSGSANGGHYYAYIKSFKRGEWYCFNDAQVTKITYEDIQKTYGGGPSRGYYSSAYSSSTNAYMLMYRQIDKDKNTECMSLDEFPDHIKMLLQSMQEQEEQERIARELDRSMCKIKLFCQHPGHHRMIEMKLKVHKNDTLAQATETALTILGLEGVVPLDCCRLVKYDEFSDSLESSFDVSGDERMGVLLGGVKSSYKFDLLLEIKKPHEQFQEYKPGGTTIKVHVVNLENEEVAAHPLTIRSHPNNTVDELRLQIAEALGVDGSNLRIVLDGFSNEFKLLNVPSKTLSNEGFRKSNKVFVEYKEVADTELPYNQSKLFKVLDCYAHTICINVSLPKVDKAILDRLRIHDCETDEDKYDSSSEEGDENADTDVMHADKSTSDNSSAKTNSVLETDWTDNSKISSINNEFSKKIHTSITPDDSSQDYDEGLGDSEIGDSSSTNGYQTNQAVHSDQSEDSSLTDSERTLVGDELSPRNNSPDIMGIEMEQDQEPANHSMYISSGQPMTAYDCGCVLMNIEAKCPLHEVLKYRMTWSDENSKDSKCDTSYENCKNLSASSNQPPTPEVTVKPHFRAWPYTDFVTKEKMLRVFVDKRITLAEVKTELEPHIGVGADCFKLYRVYSNNQEFECVKLSENLMSYGDDCRLTVKLGRALRKGEYKVKIYQLCVNDPEPFKYLIDWVLIKNMTMLKAKKEILFEIKERCGLSIPLNRCRLRKKDWKHPGPIYLDSYRIEKDIHVSTNWEMFLEILPDAEPVTSPDQLALFTRRWHPATYQLDKFQEIILDDAKVETLKNKLSEVSGIPEEFIEFAKGEGSFPCEVSLLTIHKELSWQTQISSFNTWPLCVGEDGLVIFYRDKREELKNLSEEEKREISNKENARSNKNLRNNYSPRKEKALKIYTLDSAPNSCSTSANRNDQCQNSTSSTATVSLFDPDLD